MNAQKDRINKLGSAQFAAETGQTLTHFYSIDRFGSPPDAAEKWPKGKKFKKSGKHESNQMSPCFTENNLESTPFCYSTFFWKAFTLHWYASYNQK